MLSFLIFPFSGFVVMWFLARTIKMEIFDPFFLTPFYWFMLMGGSLLLSLFFDFAWNWGGVIPIVLLLSSFLAGSSVIKVLSKKHGSLNSLREVKRPMNIDPSVLIRVILLYSCFGFIAIVL